MRAVLKLLVSLPARGLLGLVWLYQRTLSPALPVFLGPSCGCRFTPTCSHYAADAIRAHGAIVGAVLAARRLAKCTPLHPGGFDPVPSSSSLRRTSRAPRPVCRNVNLSSAPSALAGRGLSPMPRA
ncbi:MAG TPA: membrane protein insertion efficiency factor YidD [Opitutus sp.]|nr:membrane protein insertion efficiency factor YidD [Opitutus sp.]